MTLLFAVTYEIVTDESAAYGEAEETGFVCRDVTLRDAVKEVRSTRTYEVDGVQAIEPNDSCLSSARWVTVSNGREFRTGDQESRSIHFPPSLSGGSRVRIARLLGVRR
jgi:hypothetical protein